MNRHVYISDDLLCDDGATISEDTCPCGMAFDEHCRADLNENGDCIALVEIFAETYQLDAVELHEAETDAKIDYLDEVGD